MKTYKAKEVRSLLKLTSATRWNNRLWQVIKAPFTYIFKGYVEFK